MDQLLLNWITGRAREESLQNKQQHWKIGCVASKSRVRRAVFRGGKTGTGSDLVIGGYFFLFFGDWQRTTPPSKLLSVFMMYVCLISSEWKMTKRLVSDSRGFFPVTLKKARPRTEVPYIQHVCFCPPLLYFQYSKPGWRLLLGAAWLVYTTPT